ncbi:hypothetical protein HC766_07400 [Candidatus Gracilibacteria bacterium]|nr:hypothetical protein [Candidatus Gracilibacteria bacterium]
MSSILTVSHLTQGFMTFATSGFLNADWRRVIDYAIPVIIGGEFKKFADFWQFCQQARVVAKNIETIDRRCEQINTD